MARELAVDKKQGIEQLSACGMAKRQIARTLDIDRKSVDRHLASLSSKGATCEEAPTGEAPTGSDNSKGAKAPTGSADVEPTPSATANEPVRAGNSREKKGQAMRIDSTGQVC